MSNQHPDHSLRVRAQFAEAQFLEALSAHSQFALTLQTSLSTFNVAPSTMSRNVDLARKTLHQFRMRLNRALTGNGWRRNSSYVPLFLPVLEGSLNCYDRHRTLHWHITLGNVPERFDLPALTQVATSLWRALPLGTEDVLVKPVDPATAAQWSRYCSKEQRAGNQDCVDYWNAQVPAFLRDCSSAIQRSSIAHH